MTVVETLTEALNVMRTYGWVKGEFITRKGHCALGALRDARPDGIKQLTRSLLAMDLMRYHCPGDPANRFLVEAMPQEFVEALASVRESLAKFPGFAERSIIARYNNSRASFAEIEAWFEKAIELAQAAEMWAELESAEETQKETQNEDIGTTCSR